MESFKNIKQMIEIYFYISEIIKRYEKRNKYISLNRVIHPILNESLELKLYGNVDYNCILLISHLLSLQLYISSGSWMSVKFFSKQSTTKYEERWVKIIIDYELKDDSMCFIGFTLYNNILRVLGNDDIRIEVNEKTMIDDVYLITRLYLLKNKFSSSHPLMSKYSKSNGPNFASQVKLSLYSKFSSIPSEILEKILFKNFSTPKYVQKGDILCLNLNHLKLELYLDLEIYPSYIYFLVTSVSGPENSNGYLVLKDKSSLFLDSEPCYINVPNDQLVNENSIPPCLTSVFNNICHIFNLFTSHASSLCEDNITVSNHIEETRIVDGTSNDLRTEDSLVSCTGQVIIIGDKGSGKEEILKFLAQKYCCQIKWINCLTLVGDTSAATEGKLSNALSNISNCQILVFLNIGHLSKDKDGNADPRAFTKMKEHVGKLVAQDVFVAATEENQNKISEEIWSLFAYHAHIPCPTLEERKNTIYWLMNTRGHLLWSSNMSVDCRIKRESLGYTLDFVESASHRTSGFFWKDLEELFLRSLSNAQERIGLENTHPEHLDFLKKDFFLALDEMQEDRSDALNLPSIPVVRWTEIGGLESAKNELRDAIQLPIQCPAAVAMGLGRSGVLLYGPPGTGKTLLAKAVASECGLNFLSVKGPELINMYVGQSEENVREIFEKARAASPCVIFFDEIDSLAPARGRSGDSGGVMDRIVSALLAELDDASSTSDVFVLAATNRPDLLDTSLLRPGRFEKKIYIGLCENVEDRVTLLNAITSKIPLSKNVSLKHVASQLPSTLTGADFAALVNDAFYIAAEREIARIETGVPATDIQVEVTEQDLLNAAALLKPSVSSSDLKMYEEMKNTAQKYKVDR